MTDGSNKIDRSLNTISWEEIEIDLSLRDASVVDQLVLKPEQEMVPEIEIEPKKEIEDDFVTPKEATKTVPKRAVEIVEPPVAKGTP